MVPTVGNRKDSVIHVSELSILDDTTTQRSFVSFHLADSWAGSSLRGVIDDVTTLTTSNYFN